MAYPGSFLSDRVEDILAPSQVCFAIQKSRDVLYAVGEVKPAQFFSPFFYFCVPRLL